MPRRFEIVDLFAGPGGLGEGFSAAGQSDRTPMRIRLSVEMDGHAVQTLRQRALLRKFGDRLPSAYYAALNAVAGPPEWSEVEPAAWADAQREVQQLVLGQEGVFDHVAGILDAAREGMHGDTILIGGPPCQAYSLVGRSRNRGIRGYIAEKDERHYLYRQYVHILDRLRPAAFVMENVKGMLSSEVDGGPIFARVLEDLEAAGDGYQLLPIAAGSRTPGAAVKAQDFVVRAEQHGVPQARHRVFIVGIRRGEGAILTASRKGTLIDPWGEEFSVADVLDGLPHLRSGLSRGDSADAWARAVRMQAERIARSGVVDQPTRAIAAAIARTPNLPTRRRDGTLRESAFLRLPGHLRSWLVDPEIQVLPQHETRGHIPEDLGRYLFTSATARENGGSSPKLDRFPAFLQPEHRNRATGHFADRFRVQVADRPSSTVTSHISKDGHYFIHPDPWQCRSLTVREAARLQTFPDNYFFCGPRTAQYHQVGNAVPPVLAKQIANALTDLLAGSAEVRRPGENYSAASLTAP